MKKIFAEILVLCLIFFPGCNNTSGGTSTPDVSENKVAELEAENERLKSENAQLKQENATLNARLETQEKETAVQEDDITVLLTGKSTSTDKFQQMYVDLVFSVTNNTDKEIKGVQGVATFKDIFDVDIIKVNCDFTGKSIAPGGTITVDDLSVDINQFMDDHLKLYNTAYDDLHFSYNTTAIVFTDGTTKTN